MAKPKFQIYTDAAGKFRWRLKDGDGEKVASSGDSFATRLDARSAAQLVKDIARHAEIDD
ncbi:MAG TPA: YegP family protein [Gaiellaceae bacterium]|nr:YegP family protein [Gaiellaceae bacterium]